MPFAYPVMMELAGRRVVVIGADAVRESKVEGLLAGGADDVVVVALKPAARLGELSTLAGVEVRRRGWEPADLDGALLCVAASRDRAERTAIAREARARHVLVNVMDDVPNCDWAAPGVVHRGDLVLAVGTGGASPALAKQLRARLASVFGPEWAEVVRVLKEVREASLPLLPEFAERARRWSIALDLDEAAAMVRAGRAEDLRHRLTRRLLTPEVAAAPAAPPASGTVYLVGAGPGDPGLITVRGAAVLGGADVVVYDRLAAPELLALAPAEAERIYAGKERHRAALAQEAIEELLVERARGGETVVRLKGGDPFVFGRGGEEALACVRAGIPFEVVPGISAALAAPALAGIPVTHRGLAGSFAVVTGSSAARGGGTDLARASAGVDTLVVLMAAGRLEEICAELRAAGRGADEPAALVRWAGTPEQRTLLGTLADLPSLADRAKLEPPATLIVGPVAALATELADSGVRPDAVGANRAL
jgi:uroporphyrin-III C-methyltransferase / precorrin-2 dehydrogenase / sirohydrochlorin ferrochelatase